MHTSQAVGGGLSPPRVLRVCGAVPVPARVEKVVTLRLQAYRSGWVVGRSKIDFLCCVRCALIKGSREFVCGVLGVGRCGACDV